ncbi:MAG: pseudouridine synthase [Sporichthyaceae bacterium]
MSFDDSTGSSPREPGELVRLQKVLAAAGLGSRRACEELIEEGRVEVDGKRVREQGMRVDPDSAEIRVDGARVATKTDTVYLLFNKPVGVVSTMSDPEGRPCIGDFIEEFPQRLFHVGRLDTDTEGLLILTNDGDLAHRITHPSFGVPKVYVAEVPGPIAKDLHRTLRKGIDLEDGPVKVDHFRVLDTAHGRAMVEVTLHEGRTHIVRRLLEAVGHPVSRLIRTDIGPVTMGNLIPGRLRHLTSVEISALFTASEASSKPKKQAPAKRAPRAKKWDSA